jgi:hypothetical protein
MTKMTVNGVSTTKDLGQEQYETFTRKVGGKTKKYYSYDFRDHDGELFSCVKPTLQDCRAARDAWVDGKAGKA